MRPTKYEEKTESSQKSEADPSGQTGAIARYPSKFPSYPLEGTGAGLRAPLVTGNNPAPGEKGETPEGVSPSEKYKAPAFNTDDVESQKLHLQPQYNPQGPGGGPQQLFYERPFKPFKRQRAVHWYGWFLMVMWVCSFFFYMGIRIVHTIGPLGPYIPYGILLLLVEILGATTVISYGMNLLYLPLTEKFKMDEDGLPIVDMPYHVRVLVPCYKEDIDILRRTLVAAHEADLPKGCQRTIYLCDDGKDPEKRKWIASMGPDFVYVSGRKRPPGEMNGKSGNLNNCLQQLYPEEYDIPLNEVACVFDADQTALKEFFVKTLPLFDAGDDVGMVLSPQCFHNLNLHEDIFNHSNIHFWEYMQPGYDTLGFISCTGTNFLVRCKAVREAGWSPQYTMTEDFALGMEMKKAQWHCRYVQAYLAIGEAPDQIRNCFQQRSRWTKGHFQIMFNPKVSPLTQKELSMGMRIMYSTGVWSYMVAAISTPFYTIIPLVTIWIGVFPIIINFWLALGLTIYAAFTQALLFYVRTPRHLESLWFANIANQLLWWSYVKACWRTIITKIMGSTITFKATAKGGSKMKDSALRDIWLACVAFVLLAVSIAIGIWELVDGAEIFSPLLISVLWATYNIIAPYLLIHYAIFGKGIFLHFMCRICLIITFGAGAAAVGLMWAVKEVDYRHAKEFSGGAYQSHEIGVLFRHIKSAARSTGF